MLSCSRNGRSVLLSPQCPCSALMPVAMSLRQPPLDNWSGCCQHVACCGLPISVSSLTPTLPAHSILTLDTLEHTPASTSSLQPCSQQHAVDYLCLLAMLRCLLVHNWCRAMYCGSPRAGLLSQMCMLQLCCDAVMWCCDGKL
jgi:hypothetical protein